MLFSRTLTVLLTVTVAAGCGRSNARGEARGDASPYWDNSRPTAEELERARMDMSWRRVVMLDTVAEEDSIANPERWEDISPQAVNQRPMHLPLHGDISGPSVLRTQVLLNRALFSPGIIDGRWGANTEKAVYWLQKREGIPATGRVNQRTFERLIQLAGGPQQLVREHRLTEEDVEGPFTTIPDNIYEQAELECSCYESLPEKLGELFHTSPDLLRQLNPGVELSQLSAGTIIQVPNIREPQSGQGAEVAKLIISDEGKYLHAVDANDRIVFHFPTTLGSSYDPSPEGRHEITSITEDPWWHYQPDLLAHVDDSKPDARIPPGPNNAVGLVWMALDKPHYGIHGTSAPETIGYTTSAGCVRLTNWDALFLSRRIDERTTVTFRDT